MILSRAVAVVAMAAVAQAQHPISTVGAPVPDVSRGVPLRRDINDLYAENGPQWTLYIQALSKMYNASDTDPLSYFSLAGIHGWPWMPWNNTSPRITEGPWEGQCPHGEPIFLPWHRAYLMLYEQVLVDNARQIASTYPAKYRDEYMDAAANLRAPFWDWGRFQEVPPATVPLTMQVNVPSGSGLKVVNISNPLQSYAFPQAAIDGAYGEFQGGGPRIVRCPAPNSYPETANSNLAARTYKEWIYDALTSSATFRDFATTNGSGVSVEGAHNAIHWDAACAGQFLASETSAYDAIFWMHHAFIDRMWAYWEALQADKTIFTYKYVGQSRWSVRDGTTITNQSPLQPFYNSDGREYNSVDMVSLSSFGYSYEGMEWWEKTPDQMKSDVTTIINRDYGDDAAGLTRRRQRERSTAQGGRKQKRRYFLKLSLESSELPIRPVNIHLFFNGKPVGSMAVMMQPPKGIVSNGFRIDDAIKELHRLNGTRAGDVVDNVHEYVTVEIKKLDGTLVDADCIKSLEFHVESSKVRMPGRLNELPEFTERRAHGVFKLLKGKMHCVDDIVGSLLGGRTSNCAVAGLL